MPCFIDHLYMPSLFENSKYVGNDDQFSVVYFLFFLILWFHFLSGFIACLEQTSTIRCDFIVLTLGHKLVLGSDQIPREVISFEGHCSTMASWIKDMTNTEIESPVFKEALDEILNCHGASPVALAFTKRKKMIPKEQRQTRRRKRHSVQVLLEKTLFIASNQLLKTSRRKSRASQSWQLVKNNCMTALQLIPKKQKKSVVSQELLQK